MLLIIDNADDEDLDVEDYFPHGERGCILITTRDSDKRHLEPSAPNSTHSRGWQTPKLKTCSLKRPKNVRRIRSRPQ